MRFQKFAVKAVSGALQLGRKVKAEDIHNFGRKAIHTAKKVEQGLSDDNIEKYTAKAKDVGSRVTNVAGKAADVSEKVGKIANAVGLKEVGDAAMKFSRGAKSINEKGKKAGEVLGY